MLPLKQIGILLVCSFLVVADNLPSENSPKENEQISAIIDYLNANPNSTYIYKEGQHVNSQSKVRKILKI